MNVLCTGMKKIFVITFFLLSTFSNPLIAEAYIDPGSGSLIIQAAIASTMVVGFYGRVFWKKTRGLLRFFLNKNQKRKDSKTEVDSMKSDEYKQQ